MRGGKTNRLQSKRQHCKSGNRKGFRMSSWNSSFENTINNVHSIRFVYKQENNNSFNDCYKINILTSLMSLHWSGILSKEISNWKQKNEVNEREFANTLRQSLATTGKPKHFLKTTRNNHTPNQMKSNI